MEIITKIADLQQKISEAKAEGKKVGLLPTMGALHEGHITLARTCVVANECSVVSVFVNPTQFNDNKDLLLYPRTLDKDCELLNEAGVTYVFAPSVDEIYPEEDTRIFRLGTVAEVMEGKYRPGHFNGVAQVVSKLFDIVKPDNAYFGEKDFQQIAVIKAMVAQQEMNVNIVACPIVREEDGLALSSRNVRLTPVQRKNAPKIAETLFKSRTFAKNHTVAETIRFVTDTIDSLPEMRVEYYEIVDGNSLLPVIAWEESEYIVGCITVYCGDVRLIDNISYKH